MRMRARITGDALAGLPETVKETKYEKAANAAMRSTAGYVRVTRTVASRLQSERLQDEALLRRHAGKEKRADKEN